MLVDSRGRLLAQTKSRFASPGELPQAYTSVREGLTAGQGDLGCVVIGLERIQRTLFAGSTDFSQPALASSLLGAVPQGPGMYLSLGREVRLASVDATNRYREFRFLEGGGQWWLGELARLAEHSQKLRVHFPRSGSAGPTLTKLPSLLELGRYPAPCPVLKPRLEKVARKVAEAVAGAASRLPGLFRYAVGGFLADSPLGELVIEHLEEAYPHLRAVSPRFPPEVGSALLGLAFDKENEERHHLGKDPFAFPSMPDDWAPPQELLRRLYRLRKPFEEYPK